MRVTRIGLCLLLLPAMVWAGTWRDDFEDDNFFGWQVALSDGTIDVKDGEVIIVELTYWGGICHIF